MCNPCNSLPSCKRCDPFTGTQVLQRTCPGTCYQWVNSECWSCSASWVYNYCYISGTCYSSNAYAPSSGDPHYLCKRCVTSSSTSVWTSQNGLSCNDGNLCTHSDTCSGATCVGTAYSTCLRYAFTGALDKDCEVCDGNGGCPKSSSYAGSVVTVGSVRKCGCLISGLSYAHNTINPNNECQICDVTQATTAWTPLTGTSCSDGDLCTYTDTCSSAGVCVGTYLACTASICHSSSTCTGLPPPNHCDEPLYTAQDDHECRAQDLLTCVARAACSGSSAACPSVTYLDAALEVPSKVITSPASVAFRDTLAPHAEIFWKSPSALRVAWSPSPTVYCGAIATTWHIKQVGANDLDVACTTAGAVSATATRDESASNSTYEVLDLTSFAALTTAGRYQISVEVKSTLQASTYTRLVCLEQTILADDTPPVAPNTSLPVWQIDPATAATDVRFHYTNYLQVAWHAFTDSESSWQQPGSVAYQVRVATNADPGTPVYTSDWGFYNGAFSTPNTLTLDAGVAYIVKVRAGNAADLQSGDITSPSVVLDYTPPSTATLYDGNSPGTNEGLDVAAQDHNCVNVHWTPHFQDTIGPSSAQGNIATYTVGAGTAQGSDNVIPFATINATKITTINNLVGAYRMCKSSALVDDGVTVYATIKATNYAGLTTTAHTDGFVYDASPPEVNYIWDQQRAVDGSVVTAVAADVDYRMNAAGVDAVWNITDMQWPQLTYHWKVRTESSTGTIVASGTTTENGIHIDTPTFVHNTLVFVEVLAINAAGANVTTVSDGILVDLSDPLGAEVTVVDLLRPSSQVTITALSHTHLAATSTACTDDITPVVGISWRVLDLEVTPNTVVWQDDSDSGGSGTSVDTPNLDAMIHNHAYRMEATCLTKAGRTRITSADFLYDNTDPEMGVPTDGLVAGIQDSYHADATKATVQWSAKDDEAGVLRVDISLRVCPSPGQDTGSVVVPVITVPNTGTATVYPSSPMQHNVNYCWRVTTYSISHPLNTSVTTSGFLVDLTPPPAGEFNAKFTNGSHTIVADWTGFSDPEAPTVAYRWHAGATTALDDVATQMMLPGTAAGDAVVLGDRASHRMVVYVSLLATNAAGLTRSAYVALHSDLLPPNTTLAKVHDGWFGRLPPGGEDARPSEHLYHTGDCCLESWWEGIDDIDAGIREFLVAVGTAGDASKLQDFTQVQDRATFHTLPTTVPLLNGE